MVAHRRLVNFITLKQALGNAGVLAENEVDLLQYADGTQRDVFEVPYGSGDDIEGGHVTHCKQKISKKQPQQKQHPHHNRNEDISTAADMRYP